MVSVRPSCRYLKHVQISLIAVYKTTLVWISYRVDVLSLKNQDNIYKNIETCSKADNSYKYSSIYTKIMFSASYHRLTMHFHQRSRFGFEVSMDAVMHVHWTREVAIVFISRQIVNQSIDKTGRVVIVLVEGEFMTGDLFIPQKPTKRQILRPVVISMANYTNILANFHWLIKTNNNRLWCFICKNKESHTLICDIKKSGFTCTLYAPTCIMLQNNALVWFLWQTVLPNRYKPYAFRYCTEAVPCVQSHS